MGSFSYPEPATTQEILAPFLACLPVAFVSPTAPPALLRLLSPILRQRIQLLGSPQASASSGSNAAGAWLNLLSWSEDSDESLLKALKDHAAQLEPHPVSGEVELEHSPDPVRYRRVDEDTLEAIFKVADLGLAVVCVWCPEDQEGGRNGGWRIKDVKSLTSQSDDEDPRSLLSWDRSIQAAETAFKQSLQAPKSATGTGNGAAQTPGNVRGSLSDSFNGENDDSYWNQYDNSPYQTPGQQNPPDNEVGNDNAYYTRYSDVQPELDADDPEAEEYSGQGMEQFSTLKGETLQLGEQMKNGELKGEALKPVAVDLLQPSPLRHRTDSPDNVHGSDVERLETNVHEADCLKDAAVRKHVGDSIKSLYRLAKSAGIQREEFAELIETEISLLSLIESAEDE